MTGLEAGAGRGGASGSADGGGEAPGLPPGPVVIGYFPSWAADLGAVQYENLSHVNYAFVLPTAGGGLTAVEQPQRLTSLVTMAHARGVKVSIAIGGWNDGNDSAFEQMAASPTATAAFVEAVAGLISTYSLDGVDIDWEYPDVGTSATNYAGLIRALSARLRPMGKLLSAAVIGRGQEGQGVPTETFELFDFVNIMAYDEDPGPHSPYALAESCLTYWLGRGLPAKKAILGLPFYGREPYTAYKELVRADPTAPTKDSVGTVFYNGIDTIKSKTTLAKTRGGGVMIWELSMDTADGNSLLRAIRAALGN
jgi:GH18 family chitinase